MDQELVTRITPVTNTGLVTILSEPDTYLTRNSKLPFDLRVDHFQVLDLHHFSSINKYLSFEAGEPWPQILLGCLDAEFIDELLEETPYVLQDLSSDAYKYSAGRFSEIPDRELARELGTELEKPFLLERFQELPLEYTQLLSSEVLTEYVRDARSLEATVYKVASDPYMYAEELIEQAVSEHIFSLEQQAVAIDPRAFVNTLERDFRYQRYVGVDVEEYFVVQLVDRFSALNKQYRSQQLSTTGLATAISNVYINSLSHAPVVSTAAEIVFKESFRDLNDYFTQYWVAEAFGDAGTSQEVRKEISSRLEERL